jgi:hypothetical protein
MRKLLFTSILVLLTGCGFGFLGAWVDHQDTLTSYSKSVPGSNISHIEIYPVWEWLTCPPAFPGMIAAVIRYPQDWVSDEEWDYRWTITVGNGLAYLFLYWIFMIGQSLVRKLRGRVLFKSSHAR